MMQTLPPVAEISSGNTLRLLSKGLILACQARPVQNCEIEA